MSQNKTNFFITFEGADGVGKSTQVKLFAQKLQDKGIPVHISREPGGSELAERIRSVLKKQQSIDSIIEVLLIFAARRSHLIETIQPFLSQGYTVISDRFYDSSLIYQGLLKHIPIEQVMFLKKIVMGNFEPDLTFILDMPAEIAQQRAILRNSNPDSYDDMSTDEYNRIRNGFRKISEIFSFRTVLINAAGSEKNVALKIQKAFNKFQISTRN